MNLLHAIFFRRPVWRWHAFWFYPWLKRIIQSQAIAAPILIRRIKKENYFIAFQKVVIIAVVKNTFCLGHNKRYWSSSPCPRMLFHDNRYAIFFMLKNAWAAIFTDPFCDRMITTGFSLRNCFLYFYFHVFNGLFVIKRPSR